MNPSDAVDGLLVAAIAGLVAAAELTSRYRGAPVHALQLPPSFLYVGVNAAAAIVALVISRASGWTFGAPPEAIRLTQDLAAGFGAAAIFRSSLFTIRVGEQDVGIGPSAVLTTLLAAIDREVDRQEAGHRAKVVGEIMKGVSFSKASASLPTYCLTLMQNLSDTEQREFGDAIEKLKSAAALEDQVKAAVLGLQLMNIVGEDVLRAAVAALGPNIAVTAAVPVPAPTNP